MPDRPKKKTPPNPQKFDPPSSPGDAILQNRRVTPKRQSREDANAAAGPSNPERSLSARPAKKERRRRIDPTTFEKQYTDDEIEFMNAMQHFKMQSGRAFPTCGEVLKVASALGYRKMLALGLIQKGDEPTPRSEGAN